MGVIKILSRARAHVEGTYAEMIVVRFESK
jgi:hypothetical protein